MRQRAVGAIALSCSPEVLIADEPTTSLDVTVQAAFLDLLRDIQRRSNLAILFITYYSGVVAQMCVSGGGHVCRQDCRNSAYLAPL